MFIWVFSEQNIVVAPSKKLKILLHKRAVVLMCLENTSYSWSVKTPFSLASIVSLFVQRIIKGILRFTLSTPSLRGNSSFSLASSGFSTFSLEAAAGDGSGFLDVSSSLSAVGSWNFFIYAITRVKIIYVYLHLSLNLAFLMAVLAYFLQVIPLKHLSIVLMS